MPKGKVTAPQYLDYALAAASDRLQRRLSAELAKSGVPLEFWRVLNLLANGEGRAMGELADAGLVTLPTATRIIDRMVRDALVYRAPDPGDRRRVLIFISDKGLRAWGEMKASADRCQQAIVGQFGQTWTRELLGKLETLADT